MSPGVRFTLKALLFVRLVGSFVFYAGAVGLGVALVSSIFVFAALRYISAIVHELGHLVAAMLTGGRPSRLIIRPMMINFVPFSISKIGNREHRSWIPGQGRAEYVFPHRHGNWYAVVTSGGVFAELAVALACAALAVTMLEMPVPSLIFAGVSWHFAFSASLSFVPWRGSDIEKLRLILRARRLSRLRRVTPA